MQQARQHGASYRKYRTFARPYVPLIMCGSIVPTVRSSGISTVPVPDPDAHLLCGNCKAVNEVPLDVDGYNAGALPQQVENPWDYDSFRFSRARRANDSDVPAKQFAW